jgi:glycosyltransferase involved in cell wall biosynthesis
MSATSLSVVMPAYNEEGAIEAAVNEVREFVLDRVADSELVVVNDGSRDGTRAILDRLAAADARVRVVHRVNGGHGPALRTAIDTARGNVLLLIDSDRQIPLTSLAPLWQAMCDGADGAFGVRAKREDPAFRLWLTKVIRQVLPLLFGVRLQDANVPFKCVRRSLWEAARPHIPEDTLAPSLFLALFAAKRGYRVQFFPVEHRERATGVVSIRRWKLVKFCARAFRQLITFRSKVAA